MAGGGLISSTNEDARIRITERSIGLGESTIPTRSEEFTAWISERLSEVDADTAEVPLQFTGEQSLGDAVAFFESVESADEVRAEVSEVTLDDG